MPLVLIVEDDPDVREALRGCLESEGYDVSACCDGREALDHLEFGANPTVILLDLMMPRMNGLELLEAMHGDERLRDIPVVVASANRGYSPEDLKVHRIVHKPFHLGDLLEALHSAAAA